MLEKSKFIEERVRASAKKMEQHGISITEEKIYEMVKLLSEREQSNEEIEQEIRRQESILLEESKKYSEVKEIKQISNLSIENIGITLNNQQIDLMMIAAANTPKELNEALKKITNIKVSINDLELTEEDFRQVRQHVFDMYIDSLENRNDYLQNKGIMLQRKIEYLQKSGILTEEEFDVLSSILRNNRSINSIVEEINSAFGEKANEIYKIIRARTPIEKDGIKDTDLESYRNLYDEIVKGFNSITIDEEAKYFGVTLQNGTFDFSNLQKSLDFARSLGKQVRLNALCFYMDCPEEVYQLEKEQGKILAKEKLTSYVSAIAEYIRRDELENGMVVRSIDVFNELLNRFAMDKEIPYAYRGDIEQVSKDNPIYDNIAAGWQKHLSIEDICEIISIARVKLPNTEFVFNDANLEDPKKIPYFIEMIKRIQIYEQEHNVRLIDAIGTQMHVNSTMSKEDMKKMLESLSKLSLPIEITEFDMCVPKEMADQLTEDKIEVLKQQKLNEFCECIEELKSSANIKGVTIWSVNDRHNFMISLENEKLINQGEKPTIKTLHGGYFGPDMRPRYQNVKKDVFQNFNYHTHTERCGHAVFCSDEEYVKMAKENGITTLGFSDHVPVTPFEFHQDDQRMHLDEVKEYIESIENLKQANSDMTILVGFEAEYEPSKVEFLGDLKDKVDYMILGQHFISGVQDKGNPNYPIEYANMVAKAIESGIFDIVAHPDIFMQYRDTIVKEEDKSLFYENAKKAAVIICQKAKEYNVPLEINFGGISKPGTKPLQDGEYPYPHSMFWKVASQTGNLVIQGVDAHNPNEFNNVLKYQQQAKGVTNGIPLNMVGANYNPKTARANNNKLQEAYVTSQENPNTYETELSNMIITSIMGKVKDEDFDPCTFALFSERVIDNMIEQRVEKASDLDRKKLSDIEQITARDDLKVVDKKRLLERAKANISHTNQTLSLQQKLLNELKTTITKAVEMGSKTKEEIRTTAVLLTEARTTKNPVKRNKINNSLSTSVGKETTKTQKQEQPKLVKSTNNSTKKGNKGYTNLVILIIMLGFIFGIALGIMYGVFRLN